MLSFNQYFKLVDFTVTHNQFLFRSEEYDSEGNFKGNLDILIEGVLFMQMPMSLDSIKMAIASDVEQKEIAAKCPNGELDGRHVIRVEDQKRTYFIAALIVRYQRNSFTGSETSIPSKREKPLKIDDILEIRDSVQRTGQVPPPTGSPWIRVL